MIVHKTHIDHTNPFVRRIQRNWPVLAIYIFASDHHSATLIYHSDNPKPILATTFRLPSLIKTTTFHETIISATKAHHIPATLKPQIIYYYSLLTTNHDIT